MGWRSSKSLGRAGESPRLRTRAVSLCTRSWISCRIRSLSQPDRAQLGASPRRLDLTLDPCRGPARARRPSVFSRPAIRGLTGFSHGSGGSRTSRSGCRDLWRSYGPEASGDGSLISAATSISLMPSKHRPARLGHSRRGPPTRT
jgi:hypothetical protein